MGSYALQLSRSRVRAVRAGGGAAVTVTVTPLDAGQLLAQAEELAELLADTVGSGASIGFLAPLDRADAVAWWKGRAAGVAAGQLAVWVARDGERVVGTVSLAFPDKPNSRHRAELV